MSVCFTLTDENDWLSTQNDDTRWKVEKGLISQARRNFKKKIMMQRCEKTHIKWSKWTCVSQVDGMWVYLENNSSTLFKETQDSLRSNYSNDMNVPVERKWCLKKKHVSLNLRFKWIFAAPDHFWFKNIFSSLQKLSRTEKMQISALVGHDTVDKQFVTH